MFTRLINTAALCCCLAAVAAHGPAAWGAEARGAEPLPVLARVGPWPVISQFAGFQGRLWFANSVKGVNHNSADLYTYDPGSGKVRYERHLFSQDAGDPAVVDGLLYWPFEDSRYSLGWGHFMVTDGHRWRFGTIPTARIFHTHAMVHDGSRLVAATSAWRASLHESRDGGISWRALYDHPTQQGRVSRIVSLALGDGAVFAYLKERRDGKDLRRLLRLRGDEVSEVPGWPQDTPVAAMAVFEGALFAAVLEQKGTALWRTDGAGSSRVAPPRAGWRVQAIAAGTQGLWAVTAGKGRGRVWFSRDGTRWEVRHALAGGEPQQLVLYAGKVYVGGKGSDGRGILWGPKHPAPLEDVPRATTPLPRRKGPPPQLDWSRAAGKLDRAIAEVGNHGGRGGSLRELVYHYALSGPPPGLFARPLAGAGQQRTLSLFGGKKQVPVDTFSRWILLWGMGIAGQGRVPVKLLSAPWRSAPNYPEKYFESPPAAMWAASMTKQDDRATISALVRRLGRKDEPMWLKGDAVGALTVLTDQRFAYRFKAWRKWWRAAKPVWLR